MSEKFATEIDGYIRLLSDQTVTLRNVVGRYAAEIGLLEEQLLGSSHQAARSRYGLYALMRHLGGPTTYVGEVLRRDHSTVSEGSHKFDEALEAYAQREGIQLPSSRDTWQSPQQYAVELAYQFGDTPWKEPEEIITWMCEASGIPESTMLSKTRQEPIASLRAATQYLLRTKCRLSFPKIGKITRRDHSSVVSSVHKIEPVFREYEASISHAAEEATALSEK